MNIAYTAVVVLSPEIDNQQFKIIQTLRYDQLNTIYFETNPKSFVIQVRNYIKETDESGHDSVLLREKFLEDIEKLALRTDDVFKASGLGIHELMYNTL